MNALLPANLPMFSSALAALALITLVPLFFYGSLADRVWFEGKGRVQARDFGFYDALAVTGLILLFTLITASGFVGNNQGDTGDLPTSTAILWSLLLSILVELIIVAGIVGSLMLRHVPCRELFGFGRVSVARSFLRAVLLLLLALPLIYEALLVFHLLLAGTAHADESQELVRFLETPGLDFTKAVLALSAVFVAPVVEEFLFRGFIYGVVRRYAGPFVGLLVSAALFAGIHQNAQSFGGLFVLASCLALAYEWTGSLYVPMAMHALFNSLSVVSLLSGHTDL